MTVPSNSRLHDHAQSTGKVRRFGFALGLTLSLLLGFAPRTKFSDGAGITAKWYRANGLL